MGIRGTVAAARSELSDDTPRLPRVQLDSLERVRREMARLYTEAKHGQRPVQDASRLANILALIGRLIEGGELEKRMEQLEKALAEHQPGEAKPW